MSDELMELAWSAGLYDGEGSTNGYPHPKRRIKVRVRQMHRGVLDRFAAAVKVGKVFGPHKNGKSPALVYEYSTSTADDAYAALNALWPFLSEQKKLQAIQAAENFETPFVDRRGRYARG